MSKVSIIVPIYNANRYLRETLDCLLAQTYADWICILVNDGSTDDSLQICEEYCTKDSRFEVYTKPNEKSADMARAFGIIKAQTKLIMYLDADDIIETEYIEKMVSRQEETDADVISPTIRYFKHELEEEIWRLPCEPIKIDDVISGEQAFEYTIGEWRLTTGGMLYRRDLENGIEHGQYINSDEFSSRKILYNAKRVAFCNAEYLYRNHTTSTSRNLSPRLWGRLIVNRQLEDFVFEHYPNNEKIKRTIVSAVFFKQVALTAAAWLDANKIEKRTRKSIRNEVFHAYDNMNKERVKIYLPMHSKLFMRGENAFVLMSILYVLLRRMQGKDIEL